MREIVLDTETTGFDPLTGDRIVEIGCVEVINYIPTDNQLHLYINPERDMPPGAFAVHGLSEEFLRDKPVFAQICGQFLDFIGNSRLVIHNAEFDMKFINAELVRLGIKPLPMTRSLDTVGMARPEVSRRSRQPGRAVPALRHRQLQPHASRRSARRPASGRGLSGASGRSSARPCPGRQSRGSRTQRRRQRRQDRARPPRTARPCADGGGAGGAFGTAG